VSTNNLSIAGQFAQQWLNFWLELGLACTKFAEMFKYNFELLNILGRNFNSAYKLLNASFGSCPPPSQLAPLLEVMLW
jgi:hypothetical protein